MKLISTLLVLVISSFPLLSQKKADLSYQLELNKAYKVKTEVIQNTTQTVMGNEQSVQTDNIMVLSLKALKKTENEMIAEIRFDTIITVISQPPMEINSANPGDLNSQDPSEIMECIMHRMSNSSFLARMDYSGRILGFMNLEPVISEIMQGTDTLQGQMANFILQRAGTMLEEKSLKSMVEAQTFYLPGREVKKNESWEASFLVSGGGMEMTQKTDLKLESMEKDVYTITGDLITESLPGTMEMNGAKISSDISGLGKTEMKIDPSTGWVLEGSSRQQLKGEMTVNAQGNTMNIPLEINIDSKTIALPSVK
jgi:hypothetical protein